MPKLTWDNIFADEFKQEYYLLLKSFIENNAKSSIIFPSKENIFLAFDLCPFSKIKVVIVGQDPYYSPNLANGLAFSVSNDKHISSSLKNIFKELKSDLNISRTCCDLSDWAKQGVLLINRVLTVTKGQPNSHKNKGWEIFTLNIIKKINHNLNNVVYILWGNDAQKLLPYIDNKQNLIITSSHPSPLGAYKSFFGSKPFSKTNIYLQKNNKKKICW